MSTEYKQSSHVPTEKLAIRLRELARVVAGPVSIRDSGEFTMRIPAEVDRDADLVMSEAARRLEKLQRELAELKEKHRWIPVTERWPDPACDEPILVVDGEGDVSQTWQWQFVRDAYGMTHWRAMPEGPEAEPKA